ncbi:MAG: hypothetical protein J1E96_05360 [Ruminococcus sp.]|nr:hypothetical protein [Ruminococcus sp.]
MKKFVAISLALLLCFSTFSVAAVKDIPDETARYIDLGEVGGYTLLYDTETPLTDESYTRIIGDYYFTTYSEQLGLSLSNGESTTSLESAYGSLIGDSGIKSVAKVINKYKQNGVAPFDNWTVTNGAPEQVESAPKPHEKLDTGSDKVYYLFGWIYGRNYACEENDYEMGEFRFKNGKLTVFLSEEAYVGVKEENNAAWYMTNGWLGTDATSATLYNTSITGTNSNKLYVPAGVYVYFTLVENMDGSLTLSYSTGIVDEPSEEPTGDVPGGAPPPTDNPQVASTTSPTTSPFVESTEAEPPGTCPDVTQPTSVSSVVDTEPTENPTVAETVDPTGPAPTSPSPTTPKPTPPKATDPTETPTKKPTEKPNGVAATVDFASIKLNIIAATLQAGKVINLKATDKRGKKLSVTFSSSNKKVAKITSKGKIYALKRGVAKIKVKYRNKTATCLVNVVTSPKLSKNKIKLKKGQTKTVKISGKVPNLKNTYKNTKIAKVKSSRKAKKLKIRGLKRGTTKLTIKVNGVKLKLKVTVI